MVGLIANLVNSVSMLPMLPKMDRRGKLLNAAFSVCGGFVLGGQLVVGAHDHPEVTLPQREGSRFVCVGEGDGGKP